MDQLKNIICFCLLLISCNGLAQEDIFNTKFKIWRDSTLNEERRLDAFYKSFFSLRKTNPGEEVMEKRMVKWYNSIDEAIRLAEKYEKKNYIPWFWMIKAEHAEDFLKDQDKTCLFYKEALDNAFRYNDYQNSLLLITFLLNKKHCSDSIGYSDKELVDRFLDISRKVKNKLKEGSLKSHPILEYSEPEDDPLLNSYGILGGIYQNRSQYPEALKYFQFGLAYAKENHFKVYRWNRPIGKIHTDIGNYAEAEKYLLKALRNAKKGKDLNEIGGIYNDLSRLYLKTNEPDKALDAVNKAIAIMEPEMNTDGACFLCVHESYTAEAGVYNLLGDYETALKKLLKIKDHYDDPNNGSGPYGFAFYFAELATAYLGLQEYQKAIEAANKSLSYSEESTLNETRRSQNILYRSQKALGNYQDSMEALERYVTIKDSMAVLRNAQEVTRLELENNFQQEQLKKELSFQEELSRQKASRNLIFVFGFAVFLIAVVLFYRLYLIKKTQKALQQKNNIINAEKEKAQASERAKHRFLANMSHEIRTPMNAIKGMTDILIRRNPREDQETYLASIKQSSDSLLVIINDILDISKIEAGKIELEHEPFSINEVIENVHTLMQFKAEEKGLLLEKDVPSETISVYGDSSRLKQILINLIGNAIKFTEKGVVRTSVKSERKEGKLNLHFTISDTGIGIDKERINKIFKSFEQAYSDTNRKFGGTGLGLSISKKLVKIHGGKIWVESTKGRGSEFHFIIPYDVAVTPTENMKQEPQGTIHPEQLKGLRVLLVEDNQFNAVVAQEEMEDTIEDVRVDLAENGAIALEKLKTNSYDIVLMDVQMPVMNGYEASRAIRQLSNSGAHTPIIAMTANVLKEEVDKCFEAGMDLFIGKPFNTEELVQKISKLIKSHSYEK